MDCSLPSVWWTKTTRVRSSDSAVDFWTRLMGMRVVLNDHRVTGPSNRYGDAWVIPDPGHPELNELGVLGCNTRIASSGPGPGHRAPAVETGLFRDRPCPVIDSSGSWALSTMTMAISGYWPRTR